jgi:katanin p60 ATPase-containing subunit A1
MDGIAKSQNPDALVFVLCASNLPWELDIAMLRRLEKRVLVPLPNQPAREAMLRAFLAPAMAQQQRGGGGGGGAGGSDAEGGGDLDIASVAARTDGFSGSDLKLLAKECAMRPVRRLMASLEQMEAAHGGERLSDAQVQGVIASNPITADDLEAATAGTRPSAHLFADKYVSWEASFGAV